LARRRQRAADAQTKTNRRINLAATAIIDKRDDRLRGEISSRRKGNISTRPDMAWGVATEIIVLNEKAKRSWSRDAAAHHEPYVAAIVYRSSGILDCKRQAATTVNCQIPACVQRDIAARVDRTAHRIINFNRQIISNDVASDERV